MTDVLGVHGQPSRVLAYIIAALFVSISTVVANGFLVAAEQGDLNGSLWLSLTGVGKNSLLYGFALAVLMYVVCCLIDHAGRGAHSAPVRRKQYGSVRSVLKLTLVLFLMWLPIFIAFYPGILYHDTVFQLAQFFGSEPLDVYTGSPSPDVPKITDHHPVATTLMFSFFAWLGQLSGAAYNGLFVYILIQGIALATALSAAIVYAREKLQLGKVPCVALTIFFAVFPLIPLYAASLSKDVMFAPLFVGFSLVFAEIFRTKGKCLSKRSIVLVLVATSLGMVATKKIGVYLVIACTVVLLVYCRGKRTIPLVNGLLCLAVTFVVIPYVVFPLLGAGPGNTKEMLAVPYEQTALYVKEHPEDVTPSEQKVLDETLTYSTLADRYRPETADYVKNFAPAESSTIDYLAVYLKQGFRHPLTYARAFLSLEAGFIGTEDEYLPLFESASNTELEKLDDEQVLDAIPDTLAGQSGAALVIEQVVTTISQWPFIGLLFSKGLYVFMVPVLAGVLVGFHDKKYLLLFMPYLMFAALLFVSPVSTGVNAGRYVFPLVCSLPLVLGAVSISLRSKIPAHVVGSRGSVNSSEAPFTAIVEE